MSERVKMQDRSGAKGRKHIYLYEYKRRAQRQKLKEKRQRQQSSKFSQMIQ